jgi:hypothetical protein
MNEENAEFIQLEDVEVSEEEVEFIQVVNSRKLYAVDLSHTDGTELATTAKPTWELTHFDPTGQPSPHKIGALETSVDCRTGRIITGALPGIIIVRVSANVSPTAHALETFKILVKPHPETPALMRFTITPGRDAALH